MSTQGVTEFLNEKVYPSLDAAASGLLDKFSPKASGGGRTGGGHYSLDCPACNKRGRAFYYPGGAYIRCNRRDECGVSTSIWDAYQLSSGTASRRDIFRDLCRAAGVEPPTRGDEQKPAQESPLALAKRAFLKVTRGFLQNTPQAIEYLTKERCFDLNFLLAQGIGYYPSSEQVWKGLEAEGIARQVAEDCAMIQPQEDAKHGKRWLLDGRVCGVWLREDRKPMPWGRAITADAPGPKYYFSPGDNNKTVPLGWQPGMTRFCWGVEGMFDYLALQALGVPAVATGGNTLTGGQAQFLVKAGVSDFGYLIDADRAGLDGAIGTISRLEPVGVTVWIAVTPEGGDDVDKMRRSGQTEIIDHLLQNNMSGGAFLARHLISLRFGPNTQSQEFGDVARSTRKLLQLANRLTPVSRMDFKQVLNTYGIELDEPEDSATHLYLSLRDAGIADQEAKRLVARQLGVNIEVTFED